MKITKRFISTLVALMIVFTGFFCNVGLVYGEVNTTGITPITATNTYQNTKYYKENPLGIVGGFHLVGFHSVETKAHTNGNILTNTLKYRSNFGTNGVDESSYIKNIESSVNGFKSTTNNQSVLVVGKNVQVGTTDHGNAWSLNGGKVDFPNKASNPNGLWQDAEADFIDLESVKEEAIRMNQKLKGYVDSNATGHFEDQNNQYIEISNPDGVHVFHLNPDGNYSAYNVNAKGFVRGINGTLIINVDLKGKSFFTVPGSLITYADGSTAPISEVTQWQDGNVIWNFYDSSQSDGLYRGNIKNARAVTGIILAPMANVDLTQNFNGTVIASDIIVSAESHRTDFTGKTLEPTNLSVNVTKKWEGDKLEKVKVKLLTNNTNTETVSIPVTKQWVGKAGDSATVKLMADGSVKETATLTKDGGWKYTFTDLPKYDSADGHEIAYTLDEVKVDGYETVVSGTADTGFTITNTMKGKVSIPVTKTWVGKAGDSATVHLLADGEEVDWVKLNEGNHWQYTFNNLERYKDGNEIKYTVKEDSLFNYKTEITGDMTTGFHVKNTNTENTPSHPGTKATTPKTGDTANLPFNFGAMILSLLGIILILRVRKRFNL